MISNYVPQHVNCLGSIWRRVLGGQMRTTAANTERVVGSHHPGWRITKQSDLDITGSCGQPVVLLAGFIRVSMVLLAIRVELVDNSQMQPRVAPSWARLARHPITLGGPVWAAPGSTRRGPLSNEASQSANKWCRSVPRFWTGLLGFGLDASLTPSSRTIRKPASVPVISGSSSRLTIWAR